MNDSFYTHQQMQLFFEDLPRAFLRAGFEILDNPHIDYSLYGFRATYIRRYLLHKRNIFPDDVLTSLIHTVGLPFGCRGRKMIILSAPQNVDNEPIAETVKLRIQFDDEGKLCLIHGDHQPTTKRASSDASQPTPSSSSSVQSPTNSNRDQSQSDENPFATMSADLLGANQSNQQQQQQYQEQSSLNTAQPENDRLRQLLAAELANYVAHILQIISPGLIQLPAEMKLEILKRLSVDSIIRMSQVNNEFKYLIFKNGESLWRHLCLRDFNIKVINRSVHRSWMELYRDTYVLNQVEICRKERALPGLPERPALPPAPYRLQIEWLPEVLELPFYPMNVAPNPPDGDPVIMALAWAPLRRADSLDSLA